jgi:hypothetical protein
MEAKEARLLSVTTPISDILAKPEATRRSAEREKLEAYFLEEAAPKEVRLATAALREARQEREAFDHSLPTVMVMEEMPIPHESHVLLRGQYDRPGEVVAPDVPKSLASLTTKFRPNRLDLAKWIASADNPLTARVAVNRLWQLHFGTGLVKTVEDFGTQGEFPSHPELLDWLATEFVRTGWDVKRLQRLIVTSATYRQSSRVNGEIKNDPENRLLSRFPRYRLSAEMIRDGALFAGGLLVEREGGPSVKPYQPAGLWDELTGAGDYLPDHGDKLYRRGLYTFWKRTVPPPGLSAFDAFARETCWVRETRTNTPVQALTLLNDVTFVEAARMLAQRVMREEKDPEARLTLAFQQLLSRKPTLGELKILRRSLDHQGEVFAKDPAAAKKLLTVGEAKANGKLDPAELAAYATVCRLILNLDEAVTKE